MRVTLRPKAYNALIYLVFSGQDLWIQRLGLDFRNSLKRAGLVEQYKGPDRRSYLRPTDVAWDYLAEQFPAVTDPAHRARAEARPCQTTAKLQAEETTDAVLTALRAVMSARDLSLEEVLRASPPPPPPTERVIDAYLDHTGGEWHRELRLSELRRTLKDLPRADVDAALVALWRARRLVPYGIENPREMRPGDREAALHIGDNVHHFIRMKEE